MSANSNNTSENNRAIEGSAEIRGEDVKAARGLDKDAGKSLNEAGTDQKVEDAKKARDGSK
jgi:hypothetical protein